MCNPDDLSFPGLAHGMFEWDVARFKIWQYTHKDTEMDR